MLEFAEKVKSLRVNKGYTQTELANKLGINKSIISAYESQYRFPSTEVLIKLSKEFKVSIDWLIGIGKNETVDVSMLTPKQVTIVTSIIEEFKKANN